MDRKVDPWGSWCLCGPNPPVDLPPLLGPQQPARPAQMGEHSGLETLEQFSVSLEFGLL